MRQISLECVGALFGAHIFLVSAHASRSPNTHQPYYNPKAVEQQVGSVFAKGGTPGEQTGIYSVEHTNEEKWTIGAHPANERKTDDAHDYAYHFESGDVF